MLTQVPSDAAAEFRLKTCGASLLQRPLADDMFDEAERARTHTVLH